VPRLSIVIAAPQGHDERLEQTLVSVLQHRPVSSELLVALPAPYGDPYDLAAEGVRFVLTPPRTSAASCFNLAVGASDGDVIHTLASGVRVDEDWTQPAVAHFDDPNVATVAPLVVDAAEPQRIASAGIGYSWGGRPRRIRAGRLHRPGKPLQVKPLGPTLSAGFVARWAWDAVGGLDARLPATLAAIDMALLLAAAGGACRFEPSSCAATDAPSPKAGIGYGHAAERIFWRHRSTVGRRRSLLAHPVAVMWETLALLPQLAAFTTLLGRTAALPGIMAGLDRSIRAQRAIDGDGNDVLALPRGEDESPRDYARAA